MDIQGKEVPFETLEQLENTNRILILNKETNSLGQKVDHFPITDANTNYLYPIDYAAGMYHFTLQNESEILEVEKLIVE